MSIKTNQELSSAIDDLINESGYKRNFIAEKLGIANQNFKKTVHKQNISLDDANKILNIIGYKASVIIEKELK